MIYMTVLRSNSETCSVSNSAATTCRNFSSTESILVGANWPTLHKFICKGLISSISINENEWERELRDVDRVVNVILSEVLICCCYDLCNEQAYIHCNGASQWVNYQILSSCSFPNMKKFWYLIGLESQLCCFPSPGRLRWCLCNENWHFFAYVDIFLPIYNPGGILGLQISQSQIPGLRKGVRDCNP